MRAVGQQLESAAQAAAVPARQRGARVGSRCRRSRRSRRRSRCRSRRSSSSPPRRRARRSRRCAGRRTSRSSSPSARPSRFMISEEVAADRGARIGPRDLSVLGALGAVTTAAIVVIVQNRTTSAAGGGPARRGRCARAGNVVAPVRPTRRSSRSLHGRRRHADAAERCAPRRCQMDAGELPADAAVRVRVPGRGSAQAATSPHRDAGVPETHPTPGVVDTPNHRGTIVITVMTKPDTAGLYVGSTYHGPGGTSIEEPYGTHYDVECRGFRGLAKPGKVWLTFFDGQHRDRAVLGDAREDLHRQPEEPVRRLRDRSDAAVAGPRTVARACERVLLRTGSSDASSAEPISAARGRSRDRRGTGSAVSRVISSPASGMRLDVDAERREASRVVVAQLGDQRSAAPHDARWNRVKRRRRVVRCSPYSVPRPRRPVRCCASASPSESSCCPCGGGHSSHRAAAAATTATARRRPTPPARRCRPPTAAGPALPSQRRAAATRASRRGGVGARGRRVVDRSCPRRASTSGGATWARWPSMSSS